MRHDPAMALWPCSKSDVLWDDCPVRAEETGFPPWYAFLTHDKILRDKVEVSWGCHTLARGGPPPGVWPSSDSASVAASKLCTCTSTSHSAGTWATKAKYGQPSEGVFVVPFASKARRCWISRPSHHAKIVSLGARQSSSDRLCERHAAG